MKCTQYYHAIARCICITTRANANQTLGCVWETLALMGARHLISPRWLEEM